MRTVNQKNDLAARVAVLYYEYQFSQNEIAAKFGISRSYVSQLLTYARNCGVVKITINVENNYQREMEFAKRFGLKQVYILESNSMEYSRNNIGNFAAPHVARMINGAKTIGINVGDSVHRMIMQLPSDGFIHPGEKIIVQLSGGYNSNEQIKPTSLPNDIVRELGEKVGCRYLYLNCPVLVESKQLRDLIIQENMVKSVMSYWDKVDLAILGLGVAHEPSIIFSLISDLTKQLLRDSGARCDVNINFFDGNGKRLNVLDEYKITIPYDQLKKISNKVIICYGREKADALFAALKAEIIDTLFIDSIIADAVEELAGVRHTKDTK